MYKDQIADKVKKTGDKFQDAVGNILSDSETQVRGKVRQAKGAIQQTYGAALDQLSESTRVTPIGALAIAVGRGILIGKIL